jgi:hypothetical protein
MRHWFTPLDVRSRDVSLLEEEEQTLLGWMALPAGRALDAGQELGPGEKKDAGRQGKDRRAGRG